MKISDLAIYHLRIFVVKNSPSFLKLQPCTSSATGLISTPNLHVDSKYDSGRSSATYSFKPCFARSSQIKWKESHVWILGVVKLSDWRHKTLLNGVMKLP